MRTAALLLLLVTGVLAQGMPPAKRADSWKSKHNQKRLRIQWEVLPPCKETKLPDGTSEPPKAPWPFFIYVQQNESKASKKLQRNVFDDTRYILACHAVKPIKIKPHRAIDIPYLARVAGIKDPTLIFLDRDFKVVGVVKSPKDFTAKKVLPLFAKTARTAYKGKLGAYIGNWFKLLAEAERLWADEMKMEKLREKAAAADRKKAAKYDKEADEIERGLGPAREALDERFLEVEDSLQLIGEKKEALPTTFGTGKQKRKITPEELEAISTYKEFARDKNPIVRAAAVEDMGALDSPVMVQWILKAANDVDFRVAVAAGKALGRMKSSDSLAAMHAALAAGNARAKMAALLGFSQIARPYLLAVPAIKPMVSSSNDEVRRAAIKALENMGDPSAADALVKALRDKQPGLRVMAATALGTLKAKQGAAALIEKLSASDWSMRKAAADALARIRVKESVEPLLVAFERAKGLMDEVLCNALVGVTGQDFRYKKANWRRWWDKYGAGFRVPTDQEIAIARKKAAEALKGYYNPDKRKYHKIETLSQKLIFVIDISASMKDKIVIPPYAPDKFKEEFPDRRKIEIAKKELIDLLASLEPHVYFNIITFAGRVKLWRDGLVSANSKTAAIKHVAKLKAMEIPRSTRKKASSGEETKTNTYAALMAAFGLQDASVPNWKARTQVDTIFLVTDGLPTIGTITDVPKLIDAITDLNRTRGVILHVIVFDKQEGVKLGPLAKRNGGQCVVRGWTGK